MNNFWWAPFCHFYLFYFYGNNYFCSDSIYNTVIRFKHMTSWLRVLYHNLNKALHTHIWIKYWINLIGSTWCLPSWCRFFRIRFVHTRRRRRCSRKTRSRRRRCPSRWTRESDEKKNTLFHENEFQIIRSSLTDISRNYFATLAILEIHFSNFFWNNLIRLFTAKVFSQKFSVDNFFGKF